jgi:anaerobic selenocysteine-containing dehydrogenase
MSFADRERLIVVDPLHEMLKANKHLKIRIGTAALFLKSLIAVILQEGRRTGILSGTARL